MIVLKMVIKSFKKLFVTKIGAIDISLPVIEFGKDKPILSIVCGLHGNETVSIMAVAEFIKYLEQLSKINGTIRIISVANPLAQVLNQRFNPLDCMDLNRTFPGDEKKCLSQRTAHVLLDAVSGSSLVIDLHCYTINTPIMGILPDHGLESKSFELLSLFNPMQVWFVDTSRDKESRFKSTFGTVLTKKGIPNFAIEINQFNFTENEIKQIVQGLVNVCSGLKILDTEIKMNNEIKVFDRILQLAEMSGLFKPLKKPFDKINKGDIIGTITSLDTFEEHKVIAIESGTIMQISWQSLVMPGDEILAIGQRMR